MAVIMNANAPYRTGAYPFSQYSTSAVGVDNTSSQQSSGASSNAPYWRGVHPRARSSTSAVGVDNTSTQQPSGASSKVPENGWTIYQLIWATRPLGPTPVLPVARNVHGPIPQPRQTTPTAAVDGSLKDNRNSLPNNNKQPRWGSTGPRLSQFRNFFSTAPKAPAIAPPPRDFFTTTAEFVNSSRDACQNRGSSSIQPASSSSDERVAHMPSGSATASRTPVSET